MIGGISATTRFGLRFEDRDTESAFRQWHLDRGLVYAQLGLAASIVGWLVAYGMLSLTVPRFWLQAAPWFGPMIVVLVAALATTLRHPTAWPLLAHATNTVAGLVALGVSVITFGTDDPTAIVITVLFFGFTVYRLPPLRALAAVLPYLLANQLAVVSSYRSGGLSLVEAMITSTYSYTALTTGLVVCTFLDHAMRQTFADERRIQRQQSQIEDLLLNILPKPIAERLKESPAVIADRHEAVTILFADVVGFTPLAAKIPPEDVVVVLNEVFSSFDRLTAAHGVEKIKTIGDAYMAVAGLPEPRADHAEAIADLALAMQAALVDLRRSTGHPIDVRIGICSGSAVAGVIGLHKFAYDLWGDAVNVAARMESHGVPGRIQVADETHALLGHSHRFDERGYIEVKGRGALRTWFLLGRAEVSNSSAELAAHLL